MKKVYENITRKKILLDTYSVDLKRSIAFVPTFVSFSIKVNDIKYINDIISKLKNVPGIKEVYKREELFDGPFIYRLPEIYVEPYFDRGYTICGTKITYEVVKKRAVFHHHPLGVFFIKHWDSDVEFPKVIPNYMVTNIIMALSDVPLSYMADGIDVLKRLLGKDFKLTDMYLRRWRLIKKLSLIKYK